MGNTRLTWIVCLFALLAVAVPVNAQTDREQHCVAGANDSGSLGKLPSMECYSSFPDAIVAATNGAVWLPAEERAVQLSLLEQALAGGDAPTSFVIAIDFANSNYGGSTLTWTQSAGCTSTVWYYANSMPSGWNDVVSSTKGYSNCNKNKLFENTNRGGATLTCTPNCATLGVMNDAVSSREWRY